LHQMVDHLLARIKNLVFLSFCHAAFLEKIKNLLMKKTTRLLYN